MIISSINRWLLGFTGQLILCLFLLLPYQEGLADLGGKKESNAPFNSNLYLDEPITEGELNEKSEDDAFDLDRYYDDMEPPGQDGMLGRYSILAEDSLYFLIPAAVIMGALYVMPEDETNWNKDDITWARGVEDWPGNVSSWEWDQDDGWINYFGHPYIGSSYFIYARHYGYSRLESLCFSFAISSLYEIALEAWIEPVSVQDMIVTPLFGWALAEVLLPIEHYIKENDRKILNSRILGSTGLFLIDPFGHVIRPIKRWTDSMFSSETNVSMVPFYNRANHFNRDEQQHSVEEQYGLQLTVRW